jgi:hypothetical protein
MLLKCVNIDVFKLLHISWSLVVDRLIFQQNAQCQFWILLVLNLSVSYIIGNLEIHHICHGIGMQQGSEQRKLVVHYLPGLIASCIIIIILQTTVSVLFCKSMLLIHTVFIQITFQTLGVFIYCPKIILFYFFVFCVRIEYFVFCDK